MSVLEYEQYMNLERVPGAINVENFNQETVEDELKRLYRSNEILKTKYSNWIKV